MSSHRVAFKPLTVIEQEIATTFVESLSRSAMGEFDRITKLGARVLNVPVCLVSIVEKERQVFAGQVGLTAPYCDLRETPISHSFCQTVVSSRRVVVVNDSRNDDRFCNNPAVVDLGVIAYLGFPLSDRFGNILGAFCLIDSIERDWTEEEVDRARDFAAIAATQVQFQMEKARWRSLLDVMIHDLKSPLAAADFSARLLLERKSSFPPETYPLLDGILSSTGQAVELLKEANSLERRRSEENSCDLSSVLQNIVENQKATAELKSISLKSTLTDSSALTNADHWLVERVLDNLIDNAIKYSPRGGEVHISIFEREDMIGIRVRDSGPGFSEDDLTRLYQRYSRLSANPTAEETSTGLGLSIARRLASQTGGSLELVSEVGQSAEFETLFPRA
ncbi:GAF domain-containing sensor histidine kinase [Roseibacillus persicicus]|uniref:GAF domain-containing sensor histidine kinase n=1 Tax=Roseibacillus persicicus TaxID=454148 RepID=UPI001672BE78